MIFDITEFTGIFLPFAIEKTGVIHDKIRDIIGDLTALTLIILINSWKPSPHLQQRNRRRKTYGKL